MYTFQARTKSYDLSKLHLPPKYLAEIKLNSKKINDLRVLSKYIIEDVYKNWWVDFFRRQGELVNFEENDAEDEEPVENDSETIDDDSEVNYDMDRIMELNGKVRKMKSKIN